MVFVIFTENVRDPYKMKHVRGINEVTEKGDTEISLLISIFTSYM